MLEGRKFKIFTDQRPLTSAFLKAREPVSNRQKHQLSVISEFCTDIAHCPGRGQRGGGRDVKTTRWRGFRQPGVRTYSDAFPCRRGSQRVAASQPDHPETEKSTSLVLQRLQMPGCSRKVWCDTSPARPRYLVPQDWRMKIFEAVHNLSHPSGKATLAIISRTYVWEGMRRDVVSWARACEECGRGKVARHTQPPVKQIATRVTRFEHVHVDIVGPFPQDRGFRYVLTMLDRTTRWLEAIPIPDTTTDTVLHAFIAGWIARYGVPRVVTSDRGAQFTSRIWSSTLSRLGITATTTTAYHPQSNGLVERFHRSFKNALRCAAATESSWTRNLPWVLLGLRNAPRSDTATSTAEVMYGVPLRVPGMCFQQDVRPSDTATL